MTQRICHHLVAAYQNFNISKLIARTKLNLLSKIHQVSEMPQRIKCNYEKIYYKVQYHFQNAM